MNQQNKSEYVKKKSMYISMFLALVIGFSVGAFYRSFIPDLTQKTDSNIRKDSPAQKHSISYHASEKIQILEDMSAKEPENEDAWIQLGNSYFDSDQYQDAIRAYKKALALNEDNADVWTDLGVMYRRDNQPEKAVECFENALRIDPNHVQALFNKGIVLHFDLNDTGKALETWGELLKINPFAETPDGQPVLQIYESIKKEQK